MITTRYKINAPVKMKLALVADLHGKPTQELYRALEKEQPDVILSNAPPFRARSGQCAGNLSDWRNAEPA